MIRASLSALLLVGLLFFATNAKAQNLSPIVHDDGRVTLRLKAPRACEVFVNGNWMRKPLAMTKGPAGVWSATSEKLQPGNHIYDFGVDGERVPDPWNHRVKPRAPQSGSFVHVPGDAPWQPRDVPHGNVEINYHQSKLLGDTRWFTVYTPPGYDQKPDATFPVLYLLHGLNDTPIGWVLIGAGNHIVDNLLADEKTPVKEFLVVAPNAHAAPYGVGWRVNAPKFESYLLDEVIPLVENKYRVKKGQKNRAIAGFSMGGSFAARVGLRHPDTFSAIASISGALPMHEEEVDTVRDALENSKRTNAALTMFWMRCGQDDPFLVRSKAFDKTLTDAGIVHEFATSPGVHDDAFWRKSFVELAPRLFEE